MMEKAQTILATFSKLYDNEKQVELERREKGEFFNVFNTIGLRTEEMKDFAAIDFETANSERTNLCSTIYTGTIHSAHYISKI